MQEKTSRCIKCGPSNHSRLHMHNLFPVCCVELLNNSIGTYSCYRKLSPVVTTFKEKLFYVSGARVSSESWRPGAQAQHGVRESLCHATTSPSVFRGAY